MDEFVKNLTNNWKEIIESINIDGETRKVESINFFEMTQVYYKNNKLKINKRRKIYTNNKLKNDYFFKLKHYMRDDFKKTNLL